MMTFIEKYCSKEWKEFIDFHKKTIPFQKNDFIFKAGDKTTGLYIISSGKVKINFPQSKGADLLIRLAAEGSIIGHRGFGGNWAYPISAVALTDVEVSFISVEVFDNVVKTNPLFSYHMMMFFAEELRESESRIKRFPVKNLIARVIVYNFKVFGYDNKTSNKLSYTLSRKDIASKAHTTYETVVRTLADFHKLKLIEIDGKAIRILNMKELTSIANPS